MMTELLGGIEAGGTKFVCAVGTGPGDIRAEVRFPTTTPEETISRSVAFFQEQQAEYGPVAALGVASFGPLDPDPASPTWGTITSTPKPYWSNADVGRRLSERLGVPVGFDTDVNGAALGEFRWGAGQGCDPLVYITIGTGVGGGVLVNGQLLHGLLHPEMGHMPLPRDPLVDPFAGTCPFHGDCWEGLAAGPALAARWGTPGQSLPVDHPAWPLEAHYIGLALTTIILVLSPQRIILGGGVMEQPQLLPLVHERVQTSLNGYVQHRSILEAIDRYIVAPGLGNQAGVLGAFALAEQALPE